MLLPKAARQRISSYRRLAAMASTETLVLCAVRVVPILTASIVAAIFIRPHAIRFAQMLWNCDSYVAVANCSAWSRVTEVGFGILVPASIVLLGVAGAFATTYLLAVRTYRGGHYVTLNQIVFLKHDSLHAVLGAMFFLLVILGAFIAVMLQT